MPIINVDPATLTITLSETQIGHLNESLARKIWESRLAVQENNQDYIQIDETGLVVSGIMSVISARILKIANIKVQLV